ncbi:hypothetical protein ACTS9T_12625 [Empedobacter falsenii]
MKELVYLFIIGILFSCSESKLNKDIQELLPQINTIDSLNTELASMNFTIGEEAYKNNKYALCNSLKFEDCYVSDYKKAIERLRFENIYNRKSDSISKLLHELNYHFGYINKPNKNEKIKHDNFIKLHSLLNKYVSETKQPVDESFFDYKSNLNSIKQEVNILSSELRN